MTSNSFSDDDLLRSVASEGKREKRQNPWSERNRIDSETLDGVNLEKSTIQVVQSLPSYLMNDEILKNLLRPNFNQVKIEEYPNVIPLEVNYGGVINKTEYGNEIKMFTRIKMSNTILSKDLSLPVGLILYYPRIRILK